MLNKIKALQFFAECREKFIDYEDETDQPACARLFLSNDDGDLNGDIQIWSDSDDIDSLFGLGLSYYVEIRCNHSNDDKNAWPVVDSADDGYVSRLEDVAEIAEHICALRTLNIDPAVCVNNGVLDDLNAKIDALLAYRTDRGAFNIFQGRYED